MTVLARILNGLPLAAILFVAAGVVDSASATPNCSACGIIHGAPGPIAGAGLPILAIGYGAYWLAKRLRRKPS